MADIEAHFHGGPLHGEKRTLDAGQAVYPFLDDVSGRGGPYLKSGERVFGSYCFDWDGWRTLR